MAKLLCRFLLFSPAYRLLHVVKANTKVVLLCLGSVSSLLKCMPSPVRFSASLCPRILTLSVVTLSVPTDSHIVLVKIWAKYGGCEAPVGTVDIKARPRFITAN